MPVTEVIAASTGDTVERPGTALRHSSAVGVTAPGFST